MVLGCEKYVPDNWKAKCRGNEHWCIDLILKVQKANMVGCLWNPREHKLPRVPIRMVRKVRGFCALKFGTWSLRDKRVRACIFAIHTRWQLFGPNGLFKHGAVEKAANLGTPGKSIKAGEWLAVGALLLLILGIIGAAYYYLSGGKKGKGEPGAKGASKTSQSKLAGKSKISSRKSGKKSAKSSLGSKSKASQRSKGGSKSRQSKLSAKKK